jgi:hypothetical protein
MISLQSHASTRMMGMRQSALPLREAIEGAIAQGREVSIDFSGIEATQSFVDELIGVLVAKHGLGVMQQVVFKGCSKDVQAIIQFVVSDRARRAATQAH